MKSKIALITGSSRGIGQGIAVELAKAGYNIGVHYSSSKEGAEKVCKIIKDIGRDAICLKADIFSLDELKKLFENFFLKFGHLDLMVNNAGITKYVKKSILESSPEVWEEQTYTNWRSHYFATKYAAENMIKNNIKGSIINITSIHQFLHFNFPTGSVYSSNKAALAKFTQCAAVEFAEYGIRVNSITPGLIKVTDPDDYTSRERMFISRTPLKRPGWSHEIGKAVVYLASEDASFITGANLTIDGGGSLPALYDNRYVKYEDTDELQRLYPSKDTK